MIISIRYFGMISEFTGIINEEISIGEGIALLDLQQILADKYNGLENFEVKWAVNQDIVNESEIILSANDEVALLPPYAGG